MEMSSRDCLESNISSAKIFHRSEHNLNVTRLNNNHSLMQPTANRKNSQPIHRKDTAHSNGGDFLKLENLISGDLRETEHIPKRMQQYFGSSVIDIDYTSRNTIVQNLTDSTRGTQSSQLQPFQSSSKAGPSLLNINHISISPNSDVGTAATHRQKYQKDEKQMSKTVSGKSSISAANVQLNTTEVVKICHRNSKLSNRNCCEKAVQKNGKSNTARNSSIATKYVTIQSSIGNDITDSNFRPSTCTSIVNINLLNNNANSQRKERSLHYCAICSKGFKDKYSVNVHIRTHTGEKPFACSLCGKSFRQKAHLAKHYQTHIAQKQNDGIAIVKGSYYKNHRSPSSTVYKAVPSTPSINHPFQSNLIDRSKLTLPLSGHNVLLNGFIGRAITPPLHGKISQGVMRSAGSNSGCSPTSFPKGKSC